MFAYIYKYEYIYIYTYFENAKKGRIWDHMVNNGYIMRVLWDSHDIILGGSPRLDGIS
jgi:disulfide oxidoreductase YuzD